MKTQIIVLQGDAGQIQRINLGSVSGKITREKIEEHRLILIRGGFEYLGARTINLKGRRLALIAVSQGAGR